jgi:predicted RNA-binding Zn ribbon-like protein
MAMVETRSRSGDLALVGGIPAFDLANTSSGRGTSDHLEHLRSAEDVLTWAAHAGVLEAEVAAKLRARMHETGNGPRLLTCTLDLREAIYSIGTSLAANRLPPSVDLAYLSKVGGEALLDASMVQYGQGAYAFDHAQRMAENTLLGPLAWSMIDFLRTGPTGRVKQCPGPDCGWLFLDQSKNNSRRWCDMAVCGNRFKAKQHRARVFRAEEISSA